MTTYIYRIFFAVLLSLIICFTSPLAFAQTQDSTAAAEELAEKPTENIEPQTPQLSDNNLAQDDIENKIKAFDSAQDDLLKALRKRYENNPSEGTTLPPNVEGQNEPTEKTSLIPTDPDVLKAKAQAILDKVIGWLTSPPFLAQLAAIALVWFLAPFLTKTLKKRVFLFRDAPQPDAKLKLVRDYIYQSREFLRAAIQVALLAIFAIILKNIPPLGQDWLVKLAQGLAVVFLLYRMIKTFLPNPLFQKLATWIVIPLALLMVFGYYDDLLDTLNAMKFGSGENAISAMTLIKLAIFGAIFFKLGNISNAKGQDAIRAQESLDVTTREVVAKIFQIVLFGAVVIMAFTAAGISLSGLVVIFSALSLGIGLGLQPIAANFVSGMIILFDRSVKVDDFVMMEDEKFGRIAAINMRSTTVSTADGKDIIVPNTQFTEGAYENWTHDNPLQRYEVDFSVAYNTDLDALVPIVRDAVLEHADVLGEPDLPSVEFRRFGESGINMCVEFWCLGVDDGPNKFTSDVGFIIWRTLKANKIEIPFPHRVIKTIK